MTGASGTGVGAAVLRPPIIYFGGKQRIADQIVALFGAHQHYVEPFAGSLAVLLAKPASRVETVNDLDGALVTFWRVLRDRPEELIRRCLLTPHSRTELEHCRTDTGRALVGIADDQTGAEIADGPAGMVDEVEVARRVWVELTQARSGTRRRHGWRFSVDPASTPLHRYLSAYLARMPAAADRLSGVQLECRDALDVIADYGQSADALLYVDPPYPALVRGEMAYRHEFSTIADHERLADVLHRCRARVVLSSYPSALYEALYPGWCRHLIKASTTQAARSGADHRRVEVCWTNYQPDHLFADLEHGGSVTGR